MGVANMTADRQGPFLWKGNDGAGTTCDVELVYGTDDLHVIYSDGYYEGSLLKNKITGRCVIMPEVGLCPGPGPAAVCRQPARSVSADRQPGGRCGGPHALAVGRQGGRRQLSRVVRLRLEAVANGRAERPRRAAAGRQADQGRAARARRVFATSPRPCSSGRRCAKWAAAVQQVG